MKTENFENFSEFWPFYLQEHTHPLNRNLHFVGTTLGLLALTIGISVGPSWLAWSAPVIGYFFAWVGHFAVQKNKPATFKYPVWSFMGDFKMFYCIITGQIKDEYKKVFANS